MYSKETPPGKTEAIGEYFLDTGEDVVEEDWANGQNDGWVARWWRSSSVSLSSSSARLRRTTRRRRRTTATSKEEDERRRQTDGYHRADFVDGIRHPLWFHEIVETTTTKNVEDERREGDVFILAFALFKGFEIVVFRTAKAKNGRVNRTGIESQFPRKPTPNARTSRFSEPSFLGR